MTIVIIVFVLVVLFLVVTIGYHTYNDWVVFPEAVRGIRIKGDKDAPPTRGRLQHLYLKLFGWKTVAVLELDTQDARFGYRVGFVPFRGPAMINKQVLDQTCFRIRVGHEDVVFFALRSNGTELRLRLVAVTTEDNPRYEHLPLL